ncbi:P-loop NTPase fold protein [Lysinibacillus sp. NPDC093688]|uniref:P-loop NTPase fold protein n=1 Tax=Lysinibacillus sp. NPDC093688 TaxID=3390577 RepID=UPI003D05C829
MNTWIKNSGDKIVIMVDELDHCSEKTIVEFFEAPQLFLPIESIVHVNQEAVCYDLANNNMHFFVKEIQKAPYYTKPLAIPIRKAKG